MKFNYSAHAPQPCPELSTLIPPLASRILSLFQLDLSSNVLLLGPGPALAPFILYFPHCLGLTVASNFLIGSPFVACSTLPDLSSASLSPTLLFSLLSLFSPLLLNCEEKIETVLLRKTASVICSKVQMCICALKEGVKVKYIWQSEVWCWASYLSK